MPNPKGSMDQMPSDEMNYLDHLRQFFDAEVANDELTALAVHAIANDIRRLKPAISQAVWDSRQGSATGTDSGVARLNEARQLHAMYTNALGEYRQLTDTHHPAEAVAGHAESDGGPKNSGDRDSTGEHL
ncbi:MAG: hypothetical protein IH867_11355 [Chloroflexi bacterium]|nr:hypothetical protein [Chloroflexota bacterium]